MSEKKPKLMTVFQYAQYRQISATAVKNAIKNKKLERSVSVSEGIKKIDVEAADREWEENSHPSYTHSAANGRVKPGSQGKKDPVISAINQIRQQKESVKLKQEAIKLAQLQGILVDKRKMDKTLFEFGKLLRDSILSVPERLIDDILSADSRAEAYKILYEGLADSLRQLSEIEHLEAKGDESN